MTAGLGACKLKHSVKQLQGNEKTLRRESEKTLLCQRQAAAHGRLR